MTFDQLRYFVEVARLGHLGRAARSLAMSPSAVSHAIAKLEDELGQMLFTREGKRLFLSSRGKELLPRAEGIVDAVTRLGDDFQDDATSLSGHFRVAATHGLASEWVAPAWGKLLASHPRLTVELFSARTADVVRGVASREYDLGIGYSPVAPSALETRLLDASRLVIAVRKRHPLLALPESGRVEALARFPSAAPKALSGVENCESHPVFTRWGIRPETPLVFDDYRVAEAMLVATDAWALVPAWVATRAKRLAIAIAPPAKQVPLTVHALWAKTHPPGKVLQALIELLASRFAAGHA